MLKIYNNEIKQKEEFIPMKQEEVSLYVCGPTLYGDIHIGNARPIIFFDVVYMYLKKLGYNVKYVSNITDIDDKIITKAIAENVSEKELVQKNLENYKAVLSALNVKEVYKRPTVTEYMEDIINFIDSLIKNDYAYVTKKGDVYFRVSKIDDYGKISNRNIDELLEGARVSVDEDKEQPMDFALWKKTDIGVTWDTPFGVGRPGWHTECTVMIREIFGSKIDIHGGGMDLKFPHHENENAQCKAVCSEDIANIWMHNGFVNIDGEKMSKSLGNFLLVKDLLEKYSPNVLRLMLLQTNYRQPINLNQEFIEQTQKIMAKIEEYSLHVDSKEIESYLSNDLDIKIVEVMDDDFNTPNLISVLLEAMKEDNKKVYVQSLELLGIVVNYCIPFDEFDFELSKLIEEFEKAKENKNYARLDEIKEEILKLGYTLHVTRQGIKIKKNNK